MKRLSSLLILVCFSVSCGGGGNQSSPPPVDPPSVMLSVSTVTVPVGGTTTAGATVTGTQPITVTCAVVGPGSCAVSGGGVSYNIAYSAPASAPPSWTATITATAQNSAGSASAKLAVNIVEAPLITQVSPASATLALGQSGTFAVSVEGNPPPTLTCATALSGESCSASGDTVTYAISTSVPSAWSDTLGITATNSVGSVSVVVAISLQYPVPVIASVTPSAIYCPWAPCIINNVAYKGSGFYAGGLVHLYPPIFNDLTLLQGTDYSQLWINYAFNNNGYSPGFYGNSVSSPPAGPGGGTSNTIHFIIPGNQNTLACSDALGDCFSFDNAGHTIWKFKISDGSGAPDGSFNAGNDRGIAVDDITDYLVLTQPGTGPNAIIVMDANGNADAGAYSSQLVMAASAKSGYGCVSMPSGLIGTFSLNFTPTTNNLQLNTITFPTGSIPWSAALTDSVGGELDCITYGAQDLNLYRVRVSDMSVQGKLTLTGLTPIGSEGAYWTGFWHLAVLENTGVAALLAQADNKLVLVNLAAMQEIARAGVSGIPVRLAADNTSGRFIVAIADAVNTQTVFVAVDQGGNVTVLKAVVPFMVAGLVVSTDGTKLYCAGRDMALSQQFLIVPDE